MFAKGSAHMIIIPGLASIILVILGFWLIAPFFLFLFGLMLVFFRDPERKTGKGIVSAADGVVDFIKQNDEWLLISVFMNLHNVHVNRAPISGKVVKVTRKSGGRWPAFLQRSKNNARANIYMETSIGKVRITQISGVFAWRVCPYVRSGHMPKRGQRIGIIRFGSRVNVWLPADGVKCIVEKGMKVKAGETTIAEVLR